MSTVHDTMSEFFVNECGLEYYDFNKALMSSVPRDDCDYGDQEGHMGGQLAEIYSKALANLLYDRKNGHRLNIIFFHGICIKYICNCKNSCQLADTMF